MGRYDVIDIVEADDPALVEKVVMIIRGYGACSTETMAETPWGGSPMRGLGIMSKPQGADLSAQGSGKNICKYFSIERSGQPQTPRSK